MKCLNIAGLVRYCVWSAMDNASKGVRCQYLPLFTKYLMAAMFVGGIVIFILNMGDVRTSETEGPGTWMQIADRSVYRVNRTVEDKALGTLVLPWGIKPLGPLGKKNVKITLQTDAATAEKAYESVMKELHVECRERVRFGKVYEGGWDACVSGPYKPGPNCLVYSFGIKFDWSFDEAIASEYGCQVQSFDPSMGMKEHEHSPNVMFYPIGIGARNERVSEKKNQKWELRTLGTLLTTYHDDERIIDYLKMDIENYEWDVLSVIFKQNILPRVKQLGFETHTRVVRKASQFPTTTAEYHQHLTVIRELEARGFRKWYEHSNPVGFYFSERTQKTRTCCHEVVYINMNFLKPGYLSEGLPPLVVND